MIIFRYQTTGEFIQTTADARRQLPLNYLPYHLEAAADELGEDYQLGFLQGDVFFPFPEGAALPEHNRLEVHLEEGTPTVADGVAQRSLIVRANSNSEMQAVSALLSNWDAFQAAMVSAPLMKQMVAAAFPTEPIACIGLSNGIAQARQAGNTSLLEAALSAIIAAAEPNPQDLAAFVASLAGFNLPPFMTAALARLLAGA
jgi:hypothetical protein